MKIISASTVGLHYQATLSAADVWRLYVGRGDAEMRIEELQIQLWV